MKYFTKEVQISIVAILGIVVLFYGLQFLKGLSLYSNDKTFYATFEDMSGLSADCPVYADGYKIGVVKDIKFNFGENRPNVAVLNITNEMRIPQGTTAEIEADMLGNIKLNLLLANNPKERMEAGDTIRGAKQMGMLDKVGGMVPAVERILPKLDSIMTSLNALMADPAIAHSLHNVDKITSDLTVTTAQLNTLMAGVNKNVPQLMAKAGRVMDNTETITRKLSDVDVAQTMMKVNSTLDNVQEMTAKLNSNEGTLGLLMRDPGLYRNLNSTMQSADSLLIDLRSHPKRYVHFSLFGRKDK